MTITVAAVVSGIRDAVREGNLRGAYRSLIQLSDNLRAASATEQVIAAYAHPPRTSDEWDAVVAGIVEHRLVEKDAPLPDWIGLFGLPLTGRWSPRPYPYEVDLCDVPPALARRNVVLEARELESA